ncbi:MAG: response regulator [Phycisphaerales bacterium]
MIAIVDDEEAVRRALARLLRSAGLDVATFATGAEFLISLGTTRPDCLVLDLHMPQLGGLEVQSRVAENAHRVPVVIITGDDTPEAHGRALAGGAAAYLRKPVDGQSLLNAIANAIASASDGAEPAR